MPSLPSFSSLSNNKLLLIAGALLFIVFIFVVILILRGGFGGTIDTGPRISLEIWGVFDDEAVLSDVIRAYTRENRGVNINYVQLNPDDYEREVIDALARQQGPDIMYIHNTWVAKHRDKLVSMPPQHENLGYFTLTDFRDAFVDVAYSDLVEDGNIYALPTYVDTLALFYNKDLLNTAGIASPPETWDEFNDVVEQLTRIDERGRFIQSGAAIGTARNINRSTDILMLLMMQSGIEMVNESRTAAQFSRRVNNQNAGEVALQYYTDFANPLKRVYTWNDDQNYNIDTFAEERVAMMFNYAYTISLLREKSPRLNFGVAPAPQIADAPVKVNFANYWAPAVTINAQNPIEAWRFLQYWSSRAGAVTYLEKAQRPSARRDLVELQQSDLDIGVFARQALAARSWYQVDNGEIERIFADMIDDVNFGKESVANALKQAESEVSLLMNRARERSR